jgi:glycosyltransferase involved in cell wall biosynthesis
VEELRKNLIFVTLSRINSLDDHSIYSDLLKYFSHNGYNITIISPYERRFNIRTRVREINNIIYLDVKTLNIQKSNIIEKGIGTILIRYNYIFAIKKYLSKKSYDLVLYTTPPITFYPVIKYLKLKYKSFCYLLLKDIFPQNAVDLGIIKKNSILYKYFRNQEIKLYKISDYIGCMSRANLDYLIRNNKYLDREKIEINPNSILIQNNLLPIKRKINNPLKIIYGGNLGKPQGIKYLIKAIGGCANVDDVEFIIAGNGTEDYLLKDWIKYENPPNVRYYEMLPKSEYENLLTSAHIGIICLDKNFTIPNYPSRILSYMEYSMPVICLTDKNTDIGKNAQDNKYGFWCESDDIISFRNYVVSFRDNPEMILQMGKTAKQYLNKNFDISISFNKIHKHFINKK